MSRTAIQARPVLPRHVLGQQREHRHDRQHHQVFLGGRREIVAEHDDRLRGDHARRIVILEPAEFVECPDDKELRRQGGDGEIQPADAQAGQTEDDADRRGAQAGEQKRQHERNAVDAQDDVVAGEGARGHEPGRAER